MWYIFIYFGVDVLAMGGFHILLSNSLCCDVFNNVSIIVGLRRLKPGKLNPAHSSNTIEMKKYALMCFFWVSGSLLVF